MERYNKLNELQKQILNKLYVYLGFNEVSSFEEYVKYIFLNVRKGVSFAHAVNHALAHIDLLLKTSRPEYTHYVKYTWMKEHDMLEHLSVGSNIEYDPKGILRYFVKNSYQLILKTKW